METITEIIKLIYEYKFLAMLVLSWAMFIPTIRYLYKENKANYEARITEQKLIDEQNLPFKQQQTDTMARVETVLTRLLQNIEWCREKNRTP